MNYSFVWKGLTMQPRSTRIDHLSLYPTQSQSMILQPQGAKQIADNSSRIYHTSNTVMDCDPPQQPLAYCEPLQQKQNTSQQLSGGIGGGGVGNSANPLSPSSISYLHAFLSYPNETNGDLSYAPSSLPIELGQMSNSLIIDNSGSMSDVYQLHGMSGGAGGPLPGNRINNYAPTFTPDTLNSSNVRGSVGGSGGVGGGGGVGIGARDPGMGMNEDRINNYPNFPQFAVGDSMTVHINPNSKGSASQSNNMSNDRDGSPMVGVCMGQSPVVIH